MDTQATQRPTLTSVYLGRKTDKPEGKERKGWEHFAFKLTLALDGRSMDTDYRMGIGHAKLRSGRSWSVRESEGEKIRYNAFGPGKDGIETAPTPTLFDALYCLCSDASMWENARNFEDFCGDIGYDSDSRKAEGIYNACGQVAKDLRAVLGRKLYDELLAMDEDQLTAYCAAAPEVAKQ
jgi:hypothetical protein